MDKQLWTDVLANGPCQPGRCENVGDFLDVTIGPDGTPWASFNDVDGRSNRLGLGVAVQLVGGPSLAGESDFAAEQETLESRAAWGVRSLRETSSP